MAESRPRREGRVEALPENRERPGSAASRQTAASREAEPEPSGNSRINALGRALGDPWPTQAENRGRSKWTGAARAGGPPRRPRTHQKHKSAMRPLLPRLSAIDAGTKSTLAHHFSQSLGLQCVRALFFAISPQDRHEVAPRQHHGATASRHPHSTRRHRITAPTQHAAPPHHGTDAETAACPRKFPRTRRFTATSSRFVSRATVSLRRSARSAGWRRFGVGCPRPRSVRPSTRVRPRPRRPAAARRRRRMG